MTELLVFLVCMCGSAFFAGIETGVISIHRMRLRHMIKIGRPGAALLQQYLEHSDRLLGTTLVGNNITMVIISVVSARLAIRLLGPWGETVSAIVSAALVLVFGEYLPKAWFHARPFDRSCRFVSLLHVTEIILKPLSTAVMWVTRWFVPSGSRALAKPAPFMTREDLKILAREGEKDGVLSSTERDMIHRVFELSGKAAKQIMIPREKMVTVPADMPLSAFFNVARSCGFTRVPVTDPDTHTFVGIINVFFVLSVPPAEHARPVREFMRPPHFIGEDVPVDDILPKLRRFKQPMCLVRNGAKDVMGLVTTEDVLEEIVGKL